MSHPIMFPELAGLPLVYGWQLSDGTDVLGMQFDQSSSTSDPVQVDRRSSATGERIGQDVVRLEVLLTFPGEE